MNVNDWWRGMAPSVVTWACRWYLNRVRDTVDSARRESGCAQVTCLPQPHFRLRGTM